MLRNAFLSAPLLLLASVASAKDYDPFHDYEFSQSILRSVAERDIAAVGSGMIALAPVSDPLAGSVALPRDVPEEVSEGAESAQEDFARPVKRPDIIRRKHRDLQISRAMASPRYVPMERTYNLNEKRDGWFMGATEITPLLAEVSVERQMMTLYDEGNVIAEWPVSTAKRGKETTKGTFRVDFLSRNHRSSIYNNAPMPCAVFYNGDEAIHGTTATHLLGSRASEGCVRLKTENACFIHDEVEKRGLRSLTVVVR